MSAMLDMFQKFMADERAWDMFVSGQAGTGKTTDLAKVIEYCIEAKLDYVVLAFTHKACSVLRSKLPDKANVNTLHAFLKKRPGVNIHATKEEHIDVVVKAGKPARPQVIFIDEFSMVGEKDYVDIVAVQDPEYEGQAQVKAVYLGDPYQLPPVRDMQAVNPRAPYWLKLTEIKRTDNPDLQKAMNDLVSYIDGKEPQPLAESTHLKRNVRIVDSYLNSETDDKVVLAYTNKRVEQLNALIAGKSKPDVNDQLFSPTTRTHYKLLKELRPGQVPYLNTRDGLLGFGTKYQSLEYLVERAPELNVSFYEVINEYTQEEEIIAVCFGHETYKVQLASLASVAAASNKAIESTHGQQAAFWAKQNATTKMARQRAKAWRDHLTFNDLVLCIDFPYAMTVHKSQGSTYDEVYIDSDDLYKCAESNFSLYLKLLYVAISRAKHDVFMSS